MYTFLYDPMFWMVLMLELYEQSIWKQTNNKNLLDLKLQIYRQMF